MARGREKILCTGGVEFFGVCPAECSVGSSRRIDGNVVVTGGRLVPECAADGWPKSRARWIKQPRKDQWRILL